MYFIDIISKLVLYMNLDEPVVLTTNVSPSRSGNGPEGEPVYISGKVQYKLRNQLFEIDNYYRVIKAIGIGSYGLVCSCIDTRDNSSIAIKKIGELFDDLVDCRRIYREIKILRLLNHENIVKVNKILHPREGKERFNNIYVVSELLDTDLGAVLKSNASLTMIHKKYIFYQLLSALQYIHANNIAHRDLKPANILLSELSDVKLCDFGLARVLFDNTHCKSPASNKLGKSDSNITHAPCSVNTDVHLDEFELTEYIITRWYRPPEVLLVSSYNTSVDIWSAGCILAEIILGYPLFKGSDFMEQLLAITQLISIPESEEVSTFINFTDSRKLLEKLKNKQKLFVVDTFTNLSNAFPDIEREGIDLLEKMLRMNPNKRITAEEAMKHPFFDILKQEGDIKEIDSNSIDINKIFQNEEEWTCDTQRVTVDDLRNLLWDEIIKY